MSRNKEEKKRGAVISAVIIITMLAVFVGFILFPLVSEMGGVFFAVSKITSSSSKDQPSTSCKIIAFTEQF